MSEPFASTNLQTEIEGVIRRIFDAFQNHDPAGIEAGMHPAATVWDVFVPRLFRGAAERAEFHAADQEQMRSRGPLTMTIDPPVVDAWGEDTAIAKYTLTFAYEPPNATSGTCESPMCCARSMADGWSSIITKAWSPTASRRRTSLASPRTPDP